MYSSRLSGSYGVHMQGAVRSRRLVAFASAATQQMGAAGPALRGIASASVSALRLFTVSTIRFQSRALIPNRWQCLRRDEYISVSSTFEFRDGNAYVLDYEDYH